MNKYVVALYSNFTCTIEMDEVYAESALDAAKQFLVADGDNNMEDLAKILTMDQLYGFVFDQDHSIEVIRINKPRSGRPGGDLQNRVAELDSPAAFH